MRAVQAVVRAGGRSSTTAGETSSTMAGDEQHNGDRSASRGNCRLLLQQQAGGRRRRPIAAEPFERAVRAQRGGDLRTPGGQRTVEMVSAFAPRSMARPRTLRWQRR